MATSRPQANKKWIQKAKIKSGGLHKSLGIAPGKKIPKSKIAKAAKKGGKGGRQARLAQTFAKMRKEGADFDAVSDYLINEGADDASVNHILANWDPSLGK